MHLQRINGFNQSFQGLWGDKTIDDKSKSSDYKYTLTKYAYYPFANEILEHMDTFEAEESKLPPSSRKANNNKDYDEYHKMEVKASLPFTQEEFEAYKNGELKNPYLRDVIRSYASFSENPTI